jgi:isopenicillin-N N-acyltransferase-like protein
VRRLVEERWGELDIEAAQEILRDHGNKPDSICRHEDEVLDPEGKRLQSVFSMVMNLEEQTMLLTDGPPCTAAYTSPLAAPAADLVAS